MGKRMRRKVAMDKRMHQTVTMGQRMAQRAPARTQQLTQAMHTVQ